MIGTYSIITAEIRQANISDFAFRVYAEIYALNYTGIRVISDRMIADLTRRSVVTVNRAVNELKKADLIRVTMAENKRNLLTNARTAGPVVISGLDRNDPYEAKNDTIPPVLREFLDSIRR